MIRALMSIHPAWSPRRHLLRQPEGVDQGSLGFGRLRRGKAVTRKAFLAQGIQEQNR